MAELKKKRIDMTIGVIWKQLVKFALPLFIGNLFQQLYNTVDSMVVGNFIGKEALAAVGSTTPAINTLVGIFTGLSTGATVVLSQYYGAKDKKGIHDTVHTTIAMTVICGIILGGLGVILSDTLLTIMKTPADVFGIESAYLKIYFGGVFSLMLYNMGSGILRAVGDSRRPLYFLIVCTVLNALLDLLFVAVFNMGVEGAAIATIIAQLISGILIIIVLFRSNEEIKLYFKDIKLNIPILKKIISVGIPAAIQMSIMGFSNLLVQSYINFFGSNVMAGWGAHVKLENACMLPVQSIALSATTFVAQNIGADQIDRAEKGCRTTIIMGSLVEVLLVSVLVIFRNPLMGLFTKDIAVIEYGAQFITFVTPFCVFCGMGHCYAGAIRGAGDSKASTFILLGTNVVFRQVYLILCKAWFHSMTAVILAFPLAWLLGAVILGAYFRSGKWKTKAVIKKF